MSDTLPHAQIITGAKGEDLSGYIDEISLPADEIMRIDEHPNASKTSTGIYIEDIRELQLAVRASRAHGRTIAVLQDAARITPQAQNALLKLLEEPRDNLHIVLLTHTPMKLLDTVRSRCQLREYVSKPQVVQLPKDKAARIRFMAAENNAERQRLVNDAHYFEQRSKLFEAAKQFAGASNYERLIVVKRFGAKREDALEFIDASVQLYTALIKANFSPRLHSELQMLLAVDEAIRQNANTKLQLLKLAVH